MHMATGAAEIAGAGKCAFPEFGTHLFLGVPWKRTFRHVILRPRPGIFSCQQLSLLTHCRGLSNPMKTHHDPHQWFCHHSLELRRKEGLLQSDVWAWVFNWGGWKFLFKIYVKLWAYGLSMEGFLTSNWLSKHPIAETYLRISAAETAMALWLYGFWVENVFQPFRGGQLDTAIQCNLNLCTCPQTGQKGLALSPTLSHMTT